MNKAMKYVLTSSTCNLDSNANIAVSMHTYNAIADTVNHNKEK
jgi:hypothetical protein